MYIACKLFKLECYIAIRNNGLENYEMAWKELICYVEMKNSGGSGQFGLKGEGERG